MEREKNIYDNKAFYQSYIEMRKTKLNANELIEIPTIKKMLPDLNGKTVLDIGCGYGEMSKYFIKKGAKKVVAIDISSNMINLAKKINSHKDIEYLVMNMENLSQLQQKFDFVFSSLAFHYIKDFDKLIADISNILNKGGELLYSQEHPISTALTNDKKYIEIDGKRFYLVSDYNNEGKRKLTWSKHGGIKYHRSLKTIINTLIKHNLQITQIDESNAIKKAVKKVPKYIYQKDRPYFLFIKAQKS
ncbi:MAG: class I SAM-dependent methyltransferase [Christensenellales bacterium]